MERSPAPIDRIRAKLRAIEEAARHEFPTADVDVMLDEIERGAVSLAGSDDREPRSGG